MACSLSRAQHTFIRGCCQSACCFNGSSYFASKMCGHLTTNAIKTFEQQVCEILSSYFIGQEIDTTSYICNFLTTFDFSNIKTCNPINITGINTFNQNVTNLGYILNGQFYTNGFNTELFGGYPFTFSVNNLANCGSVNIAPNTGLFQICP